MTEPEAMDRALARLERAAAEAHSRHAAGPEEERIEGITAALRQALAAEPESLHPTLLKELAERYPPIPPRIEDPSIAAELTALRAQVERLQREKDSMPTRAPAVDAGPLLDRILEALLGADARRITAEQRSDPERVARVVAALAKFALELGRTFLGATGKAGETALHVDRIRSTLRAELSGAESAGSVAALLDEIKLKVAGQIEAVPTACADGARQMLRELDPQVIEDEASRDGMKIGGFRVKRYQEAWETFARKHSELTNSEDLYRTYFDGPLRRALYRLQERK